MNDGKTRTAVITGASAGIGAATALRLAEEGFDVVLGARRVDKLEEVAERCGGRALHLDVTDDASIKEFASQVGDVDVLINNAGLALGLTSLESIPDEELIVMWETNVLGLVRVTRELIPKLEASGSGHIVNLGSTAAYETYPGGGGYTASKHAVKAITHTLRLDLLGRPIRVTMVSPGLVETEFSVVRFRGDTDKAKSVYEGVDPIAPDEIAECILFALTRPPHVNVDEIVVKALAQSSPGRILRSN